MTSSLYLSLRKRHLREFADVVGTIDGNNEEEFYLILSAAVNHYGINRQAIETHMKVDHSTISRWLSGKGPHKMGRHLLLKWMHEVILAEIHSLEQNTA